MSNRLQAGFSRINITPPMGIPVSGYFIDRFASGVRDELEVQALAVSDGKNKAVILSADLLGISKADIIHYRNEISKKTGLPLEAIFIACTHTHTGPVVTTSFVSTLSDEWDFYVKTLHSKFADAAMLALDDLAPAKLGYRVGMAPDIAFIRRFRMKNGKVQTNPGTNNPDILHPIGEVDERVNVIRFARDKGDIVVVNFGNHPDTIGGDKISADFPRFVRETIEATIPDSKCIFLNGAQGDVNAIKVNAKGGDLNDLEVTFDGCERGYEHTKHMGRNIAGAVLQVYGKVHFTDVDEIKFANSICKVPSNMPKPEQLELARKYNKLHAEGKDEEIPFKAMELTTVVAEAMRMITLEHGPEYFELPLSAIAIGPAVFIGIPGEPFTGIGRGIKDGSEFEITLPCCAANGYEGYFPMQDAYDEGGYEARSSLFAAGVAEKLIDDSVKLINELR